MRFEASVNVRSAPDEAFAVVSDYEYDPRWRRGVVTMRPQPPGAARLGTTTDEVIRFLGMTTRTPGRVTDLIDGTLLGWRAEGTRLSASGTRRVEPAEDGARVALRTDLRLRGAWRAVEPLVALSYALRGDLDRLKTLIESRRVSR
jgi:hypothetical protein